MVNFYCKYPSNSVAIDLGAYVRNKDTKTKKLFNGVYNVEFEHC